MENIASLQRLTLSPGAQGRELAAAIFDFWLRPSTAQWIEAGAEAASGCAKTLRGRGRGRGLGPPRHHIPVR
eukprot:498729-Pyramimonas_sp.AAC.1